MIGRNPRVGSGAKQAAKGDDDDRRGRIHTLKLDELLIHKSVDPASLMEDADVLARTVFKHELRDGESFKKINNGTYRLIFPKLKPEAGQLRLAVIRDMVARELRRLDPLASDLDEERRTAEYKKLQSGQRVARIPDPAAAPGAGSPLDEYEANMQAQREAANRAMERMAAKQGGVSDEATLTPDDKAALSSIEMLYRPVWHAKNNVIAAYRCGLAKNGKDVPLRELYALLPPGSPDILNAKIDAFVYDKSVRALEYLNAQNLKALLIIPLHFASVDKLRYAAPFLDLSGLPPDAKNFMVFKVKDIPRDASRYRLREPTSYLRNRARAVLAELDFEARDLDILKEAGFYGVSVDAASSGRNEANLFKELERFAASAEKYRLQSFVHGINTLSLNAAALGAGFTYIDGSVISPPVNNPKHIRPFEIDTLYGV